MRSILTVIAVTLSMQLFAGNENDKAVATNTESDQVIEQVCNVICSDEAVAALGINGQAEVSFTVDMEGNVHLQEVQSNDFVLEYHIRKTLEDMKLTVSDSIVGKTLSFIMDVVQSK